MSLSSNSTPTTAGEFEQAEGGLSQFQLPFFGVSEPLIACHRGVLLFFSVGHVQAVNNLRLYHELQLYMI